MGDRPPRTFESMEEFDETYFSEDESGPPWKEMTPDVIGAVIADFALQAAAEALGSATDSPASPDSPEASDG